MAAKLTDRPLTFTVPPVGHKSLLLQQTAVGMENRIYQVRPGYFNVSAYAVADRTEIANRPCTYTIVRRATEAEAEQYADGWIVEWRRPGAFQHHYTKLAYFRGERRLREALSFATREMSVEYVIAYGHPGQLLQYCAA